MDTILEAIPPRAWVEVAVPRQAHPLRSSTNETMSAPAVTSGPRVLSVTATAQL